jgi:hypothetical protein
VPGGKAAQDTGHIAGPAGGDIFRPRNIIALPVTFGKAQICVNARFCRCFGRLRDIQSFLPE